MIMGFLKAVWQFCSYLLFTPSWGSKRRKAQMEYEEMLDRANSCQDVNDKQ